MSSTGMSPSEVRAAAVQAAAAMVGPGGSTADVLTVAGVLGAYIGHGANLVPLDEEAIRAAAGHNDKAQVIAEMAAQCSHRGEVGFLKKMAQEMNLLGDKVRLGDSHGTLKDCLRHYWGSLPS